MRSPFPGMDPYLESPAQWPDFLGRFVNALSETIAETLPPEYVARIQEDAVLLEPESGTDQYKVVPDILVGAEPQGSRAPERRDAGPATAQVLEHQTLANIYDLDPHVEYFIEIVRMPDDEVVTVVEVLSPTNKGGGGRGLYNDKRGRLIRAGRVNLVEFDLLRAGRRIRLAKPVPAGRYHAMISRAERRPQCDVYSWRVRDPLPALPIPLRPPTPDATADLGRTFALTYERGRYGRRIRYAEPPPPPEFELADAEWVRRTALPAGSGGTAG